MLASVNWSGVWQNISDTWLPVFSWVILIGVVAIIVVIIKKKRK